MTNLGLGSSLEDPWGSYWVGGSGIAFPVVSTACLRCSAVALGGLGCPMPMTLPT